MKHSVLQVSGRNTFENAYKITSKSKFSTHFVQIPYYLHPALSYSLRQYSNLRQVSTARSWVLGFLNGVAVFWQGRVQVGWKLHEMGRELAFWGDFIGVLKDISARNLKNIVFSWENVVWRSKITHICIYIHEQCIKKLCLFFLCFPSISTFRIQNWLFD